MREGDEIAIAPSFKGRRPAGQFLLTEAKRILECHVALKVHGFLLWIFEELPKQIFALIEQRDFRLIFKQVSYAVLANGNQEKAGSKDRNVAEEFYEIFFSVAE